MKIFCGLFVFPLAAGLLFSSCGEKRKPATGEAIRGVRGAPVVIRELPDETGGFGTLSFLSKVDIAALQDGRIKQLYFREGDKVEQGAPVVLLENAQILLAVERAENNYSQAKAARDLAGSRLLEGEFQAEVQLLAIEKAEAELARVKRKWEEERRKHLNEEVLFNPEISIRKPYWQAVSACSLNGNRSSSWKKNWRSAG
jgi:multidrug efflux pump subunit AcrA (membrane-fusion protein)